MSRNENKAWTGVKPMTSAMRAQCSINWANKSTGSWSFSWFVINAWSDEWTTVNIWRSMSVSERLQTYPSPYQQLSTSNKLGLILSQGRDRWAVAQILTSVQRLLGWVCLGAKGKFGLIWRCLIPRSHA